MPEDKDLPFETREEDVPVSVSERRAADLRKRIKQESRDLMEVGKIFNQVFNDPLGKSALSFLNERFINRPLPLPIPCTMDNEKDYMYRLNVRRGQTEVLNYIKTAMAFAERQERKITNA